MLFRASLLFVFFVSSIFCEECVRYDFEENFESLFGQEGMCREHYELWTNRNYSSTGIQQPNAYSRKFISPLININHHLSCASSFSFAMSEGGTVEVNFYINSANSESLAELFVYAEEMPFEYVDVGSGAYTSQNIDYQNGWQTISFPVTKNNLETFNGHIIFMGSAEPTSSLFIDSFVYKPPGFEGSCWTAPTSTQAPVTNPVPENETTTETTVKETEPTTEAYTQTTEIPTTKPEPSPTTEGVQTSAPNVTKPEPSSTTEGVQTSAPNITKPEPTSTTEGVQTSAPNITKPEPTSTTEGVIVSRPEPSTTTEGVIVSRPEPSTTTEGVIVSRPEPSTTTEGVIVSRPEPSTTTEGVIVSRPTSTTEGVQTSDPIIVTEPEPTQAPELRCPEDPHVHWLLPHEEDCNLFYYCVWGTKVLTKCSGGLHFNPVLQVCDWPYSAGCTSGQ